MRVYLGSDHAGFELKRHLIEWLRAQGHEAVDVGAPTYDATDDYPPFVIRAAQRVADDAGSFGIVLGGSGNGEAIAANKVPGVRAALVWNDEIATLAREHNDANVISIGARMHSHDQATAFVALFLCTPFSGEERHARRIAMMADYETTTALPPLPN